MSVTIYQNIIQKLSPEIIDLIHEFVDPEITGIEDKVFNLIKKYRITPSGIFQKQYVQTKIYEEFKSEIIYPDFEKSDYKWLLQKNILMDTQTLVKYIPILFTKTDKLYSEKITYPTVRYIVGKTLEMGITPEFKNIHTLEPEVGGNMESKNETKEFHLSIGQVIIAFILCEFDFDIGINYVNRDFVPIYFSFRYI